VGRARSVAGTVVLGVTGTMGAVNIIIHVHVLRNL
jgi:hypothetical protein